MGDVRTSDRALRDQGFSPTMRERESPQLRVLIANERREHPDVALVGLDTSSEHALELISEIVRGDIVAAVVESHLLLAPSMPARARVGDPALSA